MNPVQDNFDTIIDALTSRIHELESRIRLLTRQRYKSNKPVIEADREEINRVMRAIDFVVEQTGWVPPADWMAGEWVDRKGEVR